MDGTTAGAGAMRVVWYRFRCTLRARWTGYVALALLLGLVGGVAVGSAGAARRTAAAFPAYLASTNPSDLTVLTLLSSVRHRRAELAILKTLGLVRRELTRVVAWQAATVVVTGLVAGVPLGIAPGRFLWTLFAAQLDVVRSPVVPASEVALMAAGALAAAVLVALVPGRAAARTLAAALLRAE